jgi:adenine-specific DNA glycosylase
VLILHGRRICRPRPLCDQCAVTAECVYFRTVIAPEAARALGAPLKRARAAKKAAAGMTKPPPARSRQR